MNLSIDTITPNSVNKFTPDLLLCNKSIPRRNNHFTKCKDD